MPWHGFAALAWAGSRSLGISWLDANDTSQDCNLQLLIHYWSTMRSLWALSPHPTKMRLLDPEAHLRRPTELRKWRSRRRRQHVGCGRQGDWGMVDGDPWYPMVEVESLLSLLITIRYCLVVSFFAKLRTIAEHSWAINCTSLRPGLLPRGAHGPDVHDPGAASHPRQGRLTRRGGGETWDRHGIHCKDLQRVPKKKWILWFRHI